MVSILEDRKIIELFFERSEQAITELSLKYEKLWDFPELFFFGKSKKIRFF